MPKTLSVDSKLTHRAKDDLLENRLLFRPWCEDDFRGKSQSKDHNKQRDIEKDKYTTRIVSVGFMYMLVNGEGKVTERPLMVEKYRLSGLGMTFAHVLQSRGDGLIANSETCQQLQLVCIANVTCCIADCAACL